MIVGDLGPLQLVWVSESKPWVAEQPLECPMPCWLLRVPIPQPRRLEPQKSRAAIGPGLKVSHDPLQL